MFATCTGSTHFADNPGVLLSHQGSTISNACWSGPTPDWHLGLHWSTTELEFIR